MPKVPQAYIEARRDSIIDAARRAFVRKGTQFTTMADIADEAGLTPGAIYRYYQNKDELIAACLSKGADDVMSAWFEEPVPDTGDVLGDFEQLSQRTFDLLNDSTEQAVTIIYLECLLGFLREEDGEGLRAHRMEHDAIAAAIARRLKAAQEAGQLRADFDADALAEALCSFYWGARLAKAINPAMDTDAQLREVFRLVRLSQGTAPDKE